MTDREHPLGTTTDGIPIERSRIVLLLKSDGTSRALDTFYLPEAAQKKGISAKDGAVLLARPLPTKMIQSSCIIRQSFMPVFAYRVNEPVWALGAGASLSHAALGERVIVTGKHDTQWAGVFLHGDANRIVVYHPDTRSTSVIDPRHVLSVSIQNVPENQAAHYASSDVCLIDIRWDPSAKKSLRDVAPPNVELAYDLSRGALTFSVFHIGAFDSALGTLALMSFVEINNRSGVHLLNAIVHVRQRQKEARLIQQQSAEADEDDSSDAQARNEESSPRRSRARSAEGVRSRGLVMATAAPMPIATALSATEATLDVKLNDESRVLQLAPSSRTKVNAFDALGVPAKIRHLLRMNSPAYPSTATLEWGAYNDSARVLAFARSDVVERGKGRDILSGSIVIHDTLANDEPLSENPCFLDAWQNLISGRMRIDLGPNGGVRWRCYVERETDDPKNSLKLQTCRLDILVTPSSAPGKVAFKLEILTAQPRVAPEFLAAFRRLPVPLQQGEDESVLLNIGLYEGNHGLYEGKASAAHWKSIGAGRRDIAISQHDEESDDARVDHSKKDMLHEFNVTAEDVEAYRTRRFPLLMSYYFLVEYPLAL